MPPRTSETDDRLAQAQRDWAHCDPRAARRLRELDERQRRGDAHWNKKRLPQLQEKRSATPEPKTRGRKSSKQTTSVARGARTLLSHVSHFLYVDGTFAYAGGTSSRRAPGAGRAATTLDGSIGDDERRAELAWAAGVFYFDFLAIYRELRRVAPTRRTLDRLIAKWPNVDQRPIVGGMLSAGASGETILEALRQLPRPVPPPALLPVLSLVSLLGKGAHLMDAELATLRRDIQEVEDLDLDAGDARRVRDLPERARRRLFDCLEHLIHVRRIPAVPQERGIRKDARFGTALADVYFAHQSLSRRFSHAREAPHRVIDIAGEVQLAKLYQQGPVEAAHAAAAQMLGRSAGVVRRLVTQARVLGLLVPLNTK